MSQVIKPYAAGSGGNPIETLTGNVGGPQGPVGFNFNVQTVNSTAIFTTTPGNAILSWGGENVILGTKPASLAGVGNVGLGQNVLSSLVGGASNCALGLGCLQSLTSGSDNIGIGSSTGSSINTGNANILLGTNVLRNPGNAACSENTIVGNSSLAQYTGSGTNTCFGYENLPLLLTGTQNLTIGYMAGLNYSSSESNNILIGNAGPLLPPTKDQNTIRIGTQGSGAGQQNSCFIAGVYNTFTSLTLGASVVVCDSAGNLTVLASDTAGDVLTSQGVTLPPIFAAPVFIPHYTATAISYQVLTTDNTVGVTSNAAARTITMPNSGMVAGQQWTIKDEAGTAQSSNNITISGNGANIDGSATYVINTNYGSVTLYFNGTNFFII